jgi:hypothetical protein
LGIPVVSIYQLDRGRLRLIATSADLALVGQVARQMLDEMQERDEPTDPVLRELERGKMRALESVAGSR